MAGRCWFSESARLLILKSVRGGEKKQKLFIKECAVVKSLLMIGSHSAKTSSRISLSSTVGHAMNKGVGTSGERVLSSNAYLCSIG